MYELDIQAFIAYLQGTCQSLDEALNSFTDGVIEDSNGITEAEQQAIDDELFKCTTCDWWYEIAEQDEDGETCIECKESE